MWLKKSGITAGRPDSPELYTTHLQDKVVHVAGVVEVPSNDDSAEQEAAEFTGKCVVQPFNIRAEASAVPHRVPLCCSASQRMLLRG